MSYSTVVDIHKLTHGNIFNNDTTGITTAIIASAFRKVKARVQAAGLTPPDTNDTLTEAELCYAQASELWKERIMGTLLSGGTGTISTYDNVNKSREAFRIEGDALVDQYILATRRTSRELHYVKKVNE